jgi:ATP-dependent protease ClpP protease subunit
MKYVIILLATFALALATVSYANGVNTDDYDTVTLSKSPDSSKPYCPKTKISDNSKCMNCHVLREVDGKPEFGIKEIPISAGYDLPYSTKIITRDGVLGLYFTNKGTSSSTIRSISDYFYTHPEFKFFVMEMDSAGGSVMDAWRAVGILEEMRQRGIEIETRCYGFAASAGTILLVAGDVGRRFANPHAEIMLHKLWTFAMFKLDDPDTAEDQAALMKHLQDNINRFFIERTNLTKELLDTEMFKKDWWITGVEALALGVVDGYIR